MESEIYTTKTQAQEALVQHGLTETHKVRHGGARHFYLGEMSRGEKAIREEEIARRRALGVSVDNRHRVQMP